jgi:hypothetical protein
MVMSHATVMALQTFFPPPVKPHQGLDSLLPTAGQTQGVFLLTWHSHDVHVPLVVLTPPPTRHALIPPALQHTQAAGTTHAVRSMGNTDIVRCRQRVQFQLFNAVSMRLGIMVLTPSTALSLDY